MLMDTNTNRGKTQFIFVLETLKPEAIKNETTKMDEMQ